MTDHGLLPSQQVEIAGREPLDEATLYHRRERVFLIAAVLYLVPLVLLPVWSASEVFALHDVLPSLAIPAEAKLPLGALGLPLSMIGAVLVCELAGRRRARALLLGGLVANVATLGTLFALDRMGDAFAFGACSMIGSIATVELYCAIGRATGHRHLWFRYFASAIGGAVAGWSTFVIATEQFPIAPELDALAVGINAAAYVVAAVAVAFIPLYVAAKLLTVALRVCPFERRLPPAQIVDDPAFMTPAPVARVLTANPAPVVSKASLTAIRQRPFNTDEVAFFEAGENLAKEPVAAEG